MTAPSRRSRTVVPFFRLGKRFGDAFTDLYFRLPRERQEKWDKERVAHHGAIGYLAAAGALAGMSAVEGERSKRVLDVALAFSMGLAESDLHDREWWWTEGRLFGEAASRSPEARAPRSPGS